MSQNQDTIVTALMEQLIAEGPDGIAQVFTALFNLALRLERERFLGAGLYERNAGRRGYANGYKSKTVDTTAGTVTVDVPKAAGTDEPFYPQSLERGRRSSRAVMLAIAEMYVQGVSTRDAAKVMAEFGLKSLSSTQVSRAAALLDEELAAWRSRPRGEIHYLFLDARYEKLRDGGVVRDAALFSAIGIGPDGRRRVLGVSCDPSEAEIHWRAFLDSLIDRGMRGVRFVVSDDHAGLKAARRAVLPGAVWQRCQFHLAQNAIHHAPNAAIRKRIGAELRRIWNASSLQTAQEELDRLVTAYRGAADRLADWLEHTSPKASPFSPCRSSTGGACVPPTPSSGRSSRRSNAAPARSASSQTAMPCSASPPPFSSKSTRTGQPQTASTSTGTARMPDRPNSESPDFRLLNRKGQGRRKALRWPSRSC
ncbi:MAG TPA: IS256 family transposase [Candidatus Acidoferrum sp.]|nr:IS256 family transposase [Candidatus Acidoferrum sp.]